MDDTERLLAYQEIRQLASKYAVYLDARDLDRLVALFVPDVRVGRDASGHAALRADFDGSLRRVGVTFLNVGSHAIELDDDAHASGVVYCKAEIQDGGPDSERFITQAIQYHDRYARTEEGWRFVRRRHLLVYGEERATNPLAQEAAEWPQRQTGRGSVPFELDSWRRFWDDDAPWR